MIDYLFIGVILAVISLFVIVICLWQRISRINKKAAISTHKSPRNNWIIYLWFTIGIGVLVLSVFGYDEGIIIRKDSVPSDTILSILVTFLVAWQIWQSIDVKNNIKQLQEEAYQNQLSTNFDITNARNLCMALLSNHEGESALNEGKRADAYMKYFTSLCFFLMMGDTKDAARIEKNVKLIEKILNEDISENKEDYKKRLKEVDKDIDTIYEAIIIFSQSVSLPVDILNKIRTLHDKRKDYLNN